MVQGIKLLGNLEGGDGHLGGANLVSIQQNCLAQFLGFTGGKNVIPKSD